MPAALDPALTVECPLCYAPKGQYCKSRNAIAIHQDRRGALRNLEAEATRLLKKGRRRGHGH